jgi:hypothetical protein
MLRYFCEVLYLQVHRFNMGIAHTESCSSQRVKLCTLDLCSLQVFNYKTEKVEEDFLSFCKKADESSSNFSVYNCPKIITLTVTNSTLQAATFSIPLQKYLSYCHGQIERHIPGFLQPDSFC